MWKVVSSWKNANRAGRDTHRAPQWRRRLRMRVKNTGNTKPLIWNQRLFALYEGGLPAEIDPATLKTVGETDLGKIVKGHFSAHCHEVSSGRAIYNFSFQREGRSMLHLYEMQIGSVTRCLGSLPLPRSSAMMHDFVATEKYLVFFVLSVRAKFLPILLGLKAPLDTLWWRSEDGTTVLVVPIDAPVRYRRFEIDAFFQYHFFNAYEDGESIVVVFVRVSNFEKAFKSHQIEGRQRRIAC